MGSNEVVEAITLATAVVTLIGTILALLAGRRRQPETAIVTPPDDPETKRYTEITVWERATAQRPAIYDNGRPPIISIANMKGGVGKTTVAANLAGAFCQNGPFRKILLIDFDYQGSLTQNVLGQMGITNSTMSAHHLIIGRHTPEALLNYAPATKFRSSDTGQIRFFRSQYPLATIENEIMAEWISTQRNEIRYTLLKYLDSQEFRSEYDLAIIDCPPRVTTCTINALTASSYLLIPSQPDGLATPATEYFSRQLIRMRSSIFPKIKLLGVVPTLTMQSSQLKENEKEELSELSNKMDSIWPSEALTCDRPIILSDTFIPRTGPIRDAAGKGLAAYRNTGAKYHFARLANEIRQRMNP